MGSPEIVDPPKSVPSSNVQREAAFAGHPRSRWLRTGGPMATIGQARALGPCGEPKAHEQILFPGIVLKRRRWVSDQGRCWVSTDWDESIKQTRGHQAAKMPTFGAVDGVILILLWP